MTVTTGTERISSEQAQLLSRSRRVREHHELARDLLRVAVDGDIQNGHEDLHPDWLEVFRRYRETLERVANSDVFETIDNFFQSVNLRDSIINQINPQQENIAFLLGAGASKPHPSDIPTVKELLPDLLGRARRLDREQVTRLANYCTENQITNIEDLLTAVQISEFCSRNPNILSLVEYQLFRDGTADTPPQFRTSRMRSDVSSVAFIQDTLQVLFALLSNLMLPANPNDGHSAIVKYLNDRPETPIVTTNYDCCIDLALVNDGVWCEYGMEFANANALPPNSEKKASLIKLHGSLNWFYCQTCQAVWLIDIAKAVDEYRKGVSEYPIISVCSQCGGQRRGLLVPPHAMKFDVASPLQPLIADAANSFASASLIIAVGFSFADADQYIARMISKALQASASSKLVIVDPAPEVADRVRQKFGAQIPGFDSMYRIIKLQGDCCEVLPSFLRGEYFESSEGTSRVSGTDDERTDETVYVTT